MLSAFSTSPKLSSTLHKEVNLSLSLIVISELFSLNFVLNSGIEYSEGSTWIGSWLSYMMSRSFMLSILILLNRLGMSKETSIDFFRSMSWCCWGRYLEKRGCLNSKTSFPPRHLRNPYILSCVMSRVLVWRSLRCACAWNSWSEYTVQSVVDWRSERSFPHWTKL